MDEADAARVACRHRQCGRRPAAARLQDAGARQQDHGAAGARLGRAGYHDAARVFRAASVSGPFQRLSELPVPPGGIPAGQQERGHAQAACAPRRPAGAGTHRLRGPFAV
ncbi:hypothetical protein G6F59_017417 [Rhizopus arrhizus]|nr:hypothetical protein G6F59_017417 [Rhizopus arrhizus]